PRIAVEDVEDIAGNPECEQALMHLHNLALADGGRLLMTGILPPARWHLTLADLQSRVSGAGLVQLGAPDDALLSAVLVKLFADRQLNVAPYVIGYLARRMERSIDEAALLVAALDAISLTEGRAVTRKLAGRVLDNYSAGDT
ncbi:MAG: chromosomal replication initiator DnaA, partial [Paracoccaceae bacterium]